MEYERAAVSESIRQLQGRVADLTETLEWIAGIGTDCPPMANPAAFYRDQLQAAIGAAARAARRTDTEGGEDE